MAYWTNATNPSHQRGHLVKGTPFAQLLEAPELRDVETRVLDAPVIVQVQRDLRVAFNARHRIDDDGAFLLHKISLLPSTSYTTFVANSKLVASSFFTLQTAFSIQHP